MSRQHWSLKRVVVVSLSVVVWLAAGLGAYLYVGSHRTAHGLAPKRPSQSNVQAKNSPLSRLPGTLYLVQDGTLYRLRRGVFTPVLNSPGGAAGWTQPAFTPDGRNLVLVRRDYEYSDLYLIDPAGNVRAQLTHNANPTVELNHWAFYPRPSSDGALFFSYDPKDRFNHYDVVFAVWSMQMTGGIDHAQQWTLQLGKILGQVYLTTRAGTLGEALTTREDHCTQPALSPDGQQLALICTGSKQFTKGRCRRHPSG